MSKSTLQLITKEQVERLTAHLKDDQPVASKVQTEHASRSPIGGTINPYQGPWTRAHAHHLLSRAMIGPTVSDIDSATNMGLDQTVETLLADQPMPEPPINYFYEDDPNTPIGETWVDKPYDNAFIGYRFASLFGWTTGNLLSESMTITERMTLFWHNHFVTSDVRLPILVYQYISLLKANALGNFKQLTKDVTINPAMLLYLNGNENTNVAPNENFARELLELFTVGKGALAGPGDYTTFTEQDVTEISRAMTGWRVRFRGTGEPPSVRFNRNLHDEESKQLSDRLGGAIIENGGEEEYADVIDVIFESPDVARFICRKLYRWFVYYKIDDRIEADIIEPMAEALRSNNYEIKPVLELLLKSEHFYDVNSIGCLIKNPIDFVIILMKQFSIKFPESLNQRYQLWNGLFGIIELLQMVYYQPPSVAGWKAFYQAPSYNQLWINAVTLVIRQLVTDVMSTAGFESFDGRFRIDVLEFMDTINDPLDPNALIAEIAALLYPNSLAQSQIDVLKEILIPGLPDFEWTFEYQAYLNDPEDEEVAAVIETKIRLLIRAMLARPEYHLG